jgi:hypothetical protein
MKSWKILIISHLSLSCVLNKNTKIPYINGSCKEILKNCFSKDLDLCISKLCRTLIMQKRTEINSLFETFQTSIWKQNWRIKKA